MAGGALGQALGGGGAGGQLLSGALGRGVGGGSLLNLAVVGIAEVSTALARLRAIQASLDDTRPLLRAMVPALERNYRRQYATGRGWAADDPRTLLQKLTRRPLYRTGRLATSMTGGSGNVTRISRDRLFYGTSVEYAEFLARGARTMPVRDPAQLNMAALQRDLDQTVAQFIAGNGGRLRLGT